MTRSTAPTGVPSRSATVVVSIRTNVVARGRKRIEVRGTRHSDDADPPTVPVGRVPRVARVLALAHRWKGLIDDATVADQAALARLVGVSRARVTQVMDLLRLAPDIQDAILTAPELDAGRPSLRERDLWAVAAVAAWTEQRRSWNALTQDSQRSDPSGSLATVTPIGDGENRPVRRTS